MLIIFSRIYYSPILNQLFIAYFHMSHISLVIDYINLIFH